MSAVFVSGLPNSENGPRASYDARLGHLKLHLICPGGYHGIRAERLVTPSTINGRAGGVLG